MAGACGVLSPNPLIPLGSADHRAGSVATPDFAREAPRASAVMLAPVDWIQIQFTRTAANQPGRVDLQDFAA